MKRAKSKLVVTVITWGSEGSQIISSKRLNFITADPN